MTPETNITEAVGARIRALLSEKPFIRVAIDGPCGSGKSTLGARIAEAWNGNLFHMDDYYVPWAEKTPERLSQPGGNADWERFRREVLEPDPGEDVVWRPFLCEAQALGEPVLTPARPVTVIEGSYSMHPGLRDRYDLSVFLRIDPEKQRARILERNGPEGLAEFERMWIPLENAYFGALGIEDACDLVFRV